MEALHNLRMLSQPVYPSIQASRSFVSLLGKGLMSGSLLSLGFLAASTNDQKALGDAYLTHLEDLPHWDVNHKSHTVNTTQCISHFTVNERFSLLHMA